METSTFQSKMGLLSADCSHNPTILKIQAEFMALAVLFRLNTELGILYRNSNN
ncbi:MAG: hypothetical protein LBD60_04630 [Puniceicoccales bacterium]|jgi:hypothetical protein|nr:hypothetical protein [Puniceicoccales bacterium]